MRYFTIKELCQSDVAKKNNIENIPSQKELDNLTALVTNILDPLREAWGRPLYVNSGYRCSRLNKLVGGSSSSLHLSGLAADITTLSIEGNKKLFQLIQKLNLPYDLLIDEYNFKWIHVSYSPRNRKQILHIK